MEIKSFSNPDEKALTSIHEMYTLSATQNDNELDETIINEFEKILAEIALSIASRKVH